MQIDGSHLELDLEMSGIPTFSPSTMDFLGQLDRITNGLPENQRREFEMAVESELEDVIEAFNAEYETASQKSVDSSEKKVASGEKKKSVESSEKKVESGEKKKSVESSEKKSPETELSKTERKRKKIQEKYGPVEEASVEVTREEAEEFENVAAEVRPAKSKMRKAKLKWKGESDEATVETVEEGTSEGGSHEPDKGNVGSPSTPAVKTNSNSSSESRKQTANRVTAIRQKKDMSLSDIPILLKRIEDLEDAQIKSATIQRRLKQKIRENEQTINELKGMLNTLKKPITTEDEEKPSEYEEKIAKRALDIMRRDQLLENAVNHKETRVLRKFFEAPETKPDQKVVLIIDKALGYAVEELLNRSQSSVTAVNNEMRLFLIETTKAKRILLAVMLSSPEYIPSCWNGGDMDRRLQQQKSSSRKKTVSKDKSERTEESSILRSARQVLGYIFDTRAVEDECSVEIVTETPKAESVKDQKKPETREFDKAEPRRKKTAAAKKRR